MSSNEQLLREIEDRKKAEESLREALKEVEAVKRPIA